MSTARTVTKRAAGFRYMRMSFSELATILVTLSHQACVVGFMFAFSRNRLLGSYWFFSRTSLA